jgi:hypothetical protein
LERDDPMASAPASSAVPDRQAVYRGPWPSSSCPRCSAGPASPRA